MRKKLGGNAKSVILKLQPIKTCKPTGKGTFKGGYYDAGIGGTGD